MGHGSEMAENGYEKMQPLNSVASLNCQQVFKNNYPSLKHGGDTRPWVAMFRRTESVEVYDALIAVLTGKDRLLDLIAGVNRAFKREVLEMTKSVKEVFESLEKGNNVILMLVVPSYSGFYLLLQKLAPGVRESSTAQTFKEKLRLYLDSKFWPSLKAKH